MGGSKIAERLAILNDSAETILERLHNVSEVTTKDNLKPVLLADKKFDKLTAALTKQFPEIPNSIEKTSGYTDLAAQSKAFFEELEPLYTPFVDAQEFTELALKLLVEVNNSCPMISVTTSLGLAEGWLDLMSNYVRVHLLVQAIEARRLVISLFSRAYYIVKCGPEPSFGKTALWIADTATDPLKRIQKDFEPIAALVGRLLMGVQTSYMRMRNLVQLRKDGVLNIALKPEDLAKPVYSTFYHHLVVSKKLTDWVIFGYLTCVEAYATTPPSPMLMDPVNFLKTALSEAYSIEIYCDVTFNPHPYFEALFNTIKTKQMNLKKQRKVITEAFNNSTKEGGPKHRAMRIFLRQEMDTLYNMLEDRPSLLGPKFQLVLALLSLVQEEVFWWARHQAPPPKAIVKHYNAAVYNDSRITELWHLMEKMKDLIVSNQDIIRKYYAEYLKGADHLAVRGFADKLGSASPAIKIVVSNLIETLSKLDPSAIQSGTTPDLRGIRLNWRRVEAFLAGSTGISADILTPISAKMDRIVYHTLFVDSIPQLLDRFTSLRRLWYFRDIVFKVLETAITSMPNQPLHTTTSMRLLSQFPFNANQFNPEQRQIIGDECVRFGQNLMNKVTETIIRKLSEIAIHFATNESQLSDLNAVFPLLQRRKDWKPPKDWSPPVEPGSESAFRNRPNLESQRLAQRTAFQLCTSLNDLYGLTIHDHQFVPREFLRAALAKELDECIHRTVGIDGVPVRPSVVEKQLNTFLYVYLLVENFVDIDISQLLREAQLRNVHVADVGVTGSLDFITSPTMEYGEAIVKLMVNFYVDFIKKQLGGPVVNVNFVPNRCGFYSKPENPFKAELYCDLLELRSLSRIVGPYGMKAIDRELLKIVTANVTDIKAIIAANKAPLEEFAACYHKETESADVLKKFKDVDTMVTKLREVGYVMEFRDLMRQALRETLEGSAKYILHVVDTVFQEYPANIFAMPEFMTGDLLALDAGVDVGLADQALISALRKEATPNDGSTWALLPHMLAATFPLAAVWREGVFSSAIDGQDNNSHVLVKPYLRLLIHTKAQSMSNPDEAQLIDHLNIFLEVSSAILLRMHNAVYKSEKAKPNDIPAIMTFLDMFITQSGLIPQSTLDDLLPYQLLRTQYKEMYTTKQTGKKKAAAQTAEQPEDPQ